MQPETRFKFKVVNLLETYFPNIYITKVQQVTKRGDPDLIICANGKYVGWELKVGDNKVSELQQYKLDLITKAGGVARVVHPDNLDQALEELACLLK